MASPDSIGEAGQAPAEAPRSRPPARTLIGSPDDGAGRGPAGPAGRRPTGPAGTRPARATQTAGPRRLETAGTEDALRELVGGFARAFLEVEAGRRPRRQLRPVMSVELAARLAPLWLRERRPPGRVVRVCGARATRDRYEAVAVVVRGGRYGAVAVTLARKRGRWLVIEAGRPEDSHPASSAAHAPASVR